MKNLVLLVTAGMLFIGGCAIVPLQVPVAQQCGGFGYRCDSFGYCGQMWIPGPCYGPTYGYAPYATPYYAAPIPPRYWWHGGWHRGHHR